MTKLFALAAVTVLATGSAALAVDQSDIQADKGAIAKDNAAIAKQDANISENRAEKEAAKAKGDYANQASESVQIGANKTAKAAKQAEKKVDEKILEHNQQRMNEQNNAR